MKKSEIFALTARILLKLVKGDRLKLENSAG